MDGRMLRPRGLSCRELHPSAGIAASIGSLTAADAPNGTPLWPRAADHLITAGAGPEHRSGAETYQREDHVRNAARSQLLVVGGASRRARGEAAPPGRARRARGSRRELGLTRWLGRCCG